MKKTIVFSIALLFPTAFCTFTSCEDDNNPDTCIADTTGSYAQGVSVTGRVGAYTYVDLGLKSGIKWATYNIGASSPNELGDSFAWGVTKGTTYLGDVRYNNVIETPWAGYKWCSGRDSSFTKYCTNASFGAVDNLTTLQLSNDAATANWGISWRMPTTNEIQELLDGCDWIPYYDEDGYVGAKGTSKTNGNTILLPGIDETITINNTSEFVSYIGNTYYWTSSLDESNSSNAKVLFFQQMKGADYTNARVDSYKRCCQALVRAVVIE